MFDVFCTSCTYSYEYSMYSWIIEIAGGGVDYFSSWFKTAKSIMTDQNATLEARNF